MRGWLAACVVACAMGSGTGTGTAVWTPAIGPEWFIEAYVQQGRFRQAHELVAELQRALGPELETAIGSASAVRNELHRRARATLIRARIRLLLAERDWADGRVIAERCRAAEPLVCTFAQGYAAARLAWPGAKANLIAEAGMCARRLEQAVSNPVSVAELYRVLVRAAMAAAQEETPELELLVAHAVSLERRLRETDQIDMPLQPASEIAGDLWLQVYRDATARDSYRATLDDWPRRAASLLGVARASARLGDDAAAEEAYRALLDVWPAADRTRPELLEARRALGMVGRAMLLLIGCFTTTPPRDA